MVSDLANHQGTKFEATVAQMLHHGCFPKTGCNRFRGSFFATFLEKQKSKSQTIQKPHKNILLSFIAH
jgi:hypothetical protein